MRTPPVALPDKAKAKLDELVVLKDLALDSSRSANQRLQALPADADPRLRGKLESERDKATERHRQLAMVVSRINQWWTELRLPPGSTLELQPPSRSELKPGETNAEAVAKVRIEIGGLKQEIAQVRRAPLKVASQQEALSAYLERLVQAARPKVGFDVKGNARVLWTEDLVVSKDDLLGLLTFILGPEQIAAAFGTDIEQEDEREDAVTPLEREEKLGELAAQLLRLERHEVALMGDDESIVPRSDVNPLAYLGIRIAVAPAAAQEQAQVA
jgi:hypothetical protein